MSKKDYVSIDIGVKNFAYAMFKENDTQKYGNDNNDKKQSIEIIDFNIIELDKSSKGNNLIEFLIEWFNNFKNLKCVIIEQQVKSNVKALIIQNIIITICVMKGFNYYVFNPKLKFKLMNEKQKMNYKERKQKSIDYILMYLNKKHSSLDLKLKFMRFIKKDDVADALNMGLMYLNGLNELNTRKNTRKNTRNFTEISKKIVEFYS